MSKSGFRRLSSAFAVFLLCLGPAQSQDIVLKTSDGKIELKGEFIDFDGEFYTIRGALGELTVDGRGVICSGEACPSPESLVSKFSVTGPGNLSHGLLPALIENFGFALNGRTTTSAMKNTREIIVSSDTGADMARVNLTATNSAAGFAAFRDGNTTFVVSNRQVSKAEAEEIAKAGLGDMNAQERKLLLALDAAVLVVSDVNPIGAVTRDQAKRILSGQATSWADLGGADIPINLFLFDASAQTHQIVSERVLGGADINTAYATRVFQSFADLSDAVSGDPFAIGLTSYSALRNAKPLDIQDSCGLLLRPTVFNIKTGAYPLSFGYFAYTPEKRLPLFARELLEYASSDEAQDIVADAGFVDLGTMASSLDQQGLRLANAILTAEPKFNLADLRAMVVELNAATRLSTTFRFDAGSDRLDTQSVANVQRLARSLAIGEFANKQILVIGFSDSAGGKEQGAELSKLRAKTVRAELIKAAPEGSLDQVDFKVMDLGAISPVGCNDSKRGRQINRRVEIWVRDRL